ncbi:GDSL-type esterase/lipase family protein [Nocardiopsis sp. NPDC058789]|uniref:GDSL-type esterase/lipase family protein n=1 Tax=Nocardiopsis sp. NPDC058789 TaxID=3346634 RepID=UPI00366DAD61
MDGGRTAGHGTDRPATVWDHVLRVVSLGTVVVLLLVAFNASVSRDVAVRPAEERGESGALPLSDVLDGTGVSQDGTVGSADLDGAGNSLSARTLAAAGWRPGQELVLLDTPLELPAYGPGRPDHVTADGQSVALSAAPARWDSLTFLATGTRTDGTGADVRGEGRVVYADGTTQDFPLSVPDWAAGPAGDAALSLPYANSATGFGQGAIGSVRLYARSVPLDQGREVDHVVLPTVADDDASLHVFSLGGRPATQAWTGTWARAVSGYASVGPWEDQTLRMTVRTTTGGHKARLRFDNTFAARPVTLGAVSVSLRGQGAATHGAAVPLTFDGAPGAVIPAGGRLVTDPVDLLLPPQTELLVSVHLPERVTAAPIHYASVDTNYTSVPGSGDQTLDRTGEPFTGLVEQWPFLTGVEVTDGPGAVVTYGDSITDGLRSTRDGHARWPDVLSARLHRSQDLPNLGVLNLGVAGNRITSDGYPGEGVSTYASGVSMLHRAQRDVFAQNGVEALVVFAGINDLRWGATPDVVVAGLGRLALTAEEHGVRVFVATLAPCAGGSRCTPEVEEARQRVNAHLRSEASDPESVFTGVWDFDAVLRDPALPERLRPEFDSGDHLHPNDAGLRAVAESVDLYELVGG